jgi:hypothetical protein
VTYAIEYCAFGKDDRQPGEAFENSLGRRSLRLLGKLQGVASRVAEELPMSIGGGLFEKCRGYPDLFEVRTILGRDLARYLVGLDGSAKPPRMVLLHGLAKRVGQPTPKADLERAAAYWRDYRRTRRVSPEEDPR